MTDDMQPENNGNTPPSGRPPVDPRNPITPPPPPIMAGGYPPIAAAPRQKSFMSKVVMYFLVSFLSLSLLINFYLGAIVAATMRGPQEAVFTEGDVADRIVIIPISGMINDETTAFIRRSLEHLKKNPPKAIVLRVDSPGGGVGASDRIWHYLTLFRGEVDIPMVASYGSYAASGGYYTSVLADYIYAEPTTITGSIGVIAQTFTAQELLEKVGVKPEVVAASDANMKDVMNWTRDWTERDRETLKHFLDVDHQRFIDIVHQGREEHLSREEAASLATGEPYSSEQALEKKLIDKVGYLNDAIDEAAKRAGLTSVKPRVTVIAPAQSLMDAFMSNTPAIDRQSMTVDRLRSMIEQAATPHMEYRMR